VVGGDRPGREGGGFEAVPSDPDGMRIFNTEAQRKRRRGAWGKKRFSPRITCKKRG
jgi:hypothetical protein